MRVGIAVIKLVLRTNKVLADGTHPIMLRVSFHGMKERASGYSCSVKSWDKKAECIKRGYPNFVMVNAELRKIKEEAIRKRDSLIALGVEYTPSMILFKEEVKSSLSFNLKDLIEEYIHSKGIAHRTSEKYHTLFNSISKFIGGKDILITDIDESFCRRYATHLEHCNISNGVIRSYLSLIGALCHFAIDNGVSMKYPFEKFKYHRSYVESKNELYIHSRSIDVLFDLFFDEMIVRDGDMWHYRDGSIDKLMDIHSSLYALYLYLLGFYLKGLSPYDISILKRSTIKVIQIKDTWCYAIDGSRSKTGQKFKIRVPQHCIKSQVLINTMMMFGYGEYFLPTLNGCVGDKKHRVLNVYYRLSDKLIDWFRKANEKIAEINVSNEHVNDIPFIDLNCRYYSYRHSYIMSEIQKPNVNLLKLATETGKSITSLHEYLTILNDLDLI